MLFEIITPSDIKAYFHFIEESVAARRKAEESSDRPSKGGRGVREDKFHFLFQTKSPDTGEQVYSRQELSNETNLLVIAGSDNAFINVCSFSSISYQTRDHMRRW